MGIEKHAGQIGMTNFTWIDGQRFRIVTSALVTRYTKGNVEYQFTVCRVERRPQQEEEAA